eukprot:PITA_06367
MLQETLCSADQITRAMQALVPAWSFHAIDAVGRSGGLAIGVNPRSIKMDSTWGGSGFIGLEIFSAELGMTLRVVNVYAPCSHRESFWQHLLQLSMMNEDRVIIGGDLNFSLGFRESWGSEAQFDPITDYMTNLLEQTNFLDIPMQRLLPTWRNRRVGDAALSHRLDRFLMKGTLQQRLHLFRQWVGSGGLSDHNPIYLEIQGPFKKLKAPFKFNHTWLKDPTYVKMIEDYWISHPINDTESLAKGFCRNLSEIKHITIKNLYKCPREANLLDIINVANHFPRFVEEEDVESLISPVTVEELEGVLKWFKKDKSPGRDGWTIEFFLAFFDVLGQDLLRVVEESRTTGSIYHAINSTFIALIPKSDSLASFDDYRPISLCNCLYKIISKTIANRLRPILSRSISPQQFAFLGSRQIHEAIGLAQEALHSIWSKHLKSILLKIDLSKAFDRVSWLYIKMILIHLGFPHAYITWIMACLTSPSFSILINGSATPFFHSERGLRQGCPLSPLLFLLVMEGLSRLMDSAKRAGDIGGLRISDLCYLTHLLFVDDVLILLDGSVRDSRTFSKILQLFSAATGMLPNQLKSTITCARTSAQESRTALQAFPYSVHPLDRGLKYPGFNLKPTCQRIADWVWLVAKLEKRLTGWRYRYLSRDGRLVLIKSVLEATPVFWMALAWIPRNILGRLQ